MTSQGWLEIMSIFITVSIMNILTNRFQAGKECRKYLCLYLCSVWCAYDTERTRISCVECLDGVVFYFALWQIYHSPQRIMS